MSFRVIVGLHYAAMCLRPANLPKARPKGAKAAGLRYEKALAAAIPRAEHGQWFEFTDLNGPGHCQMDLLIVGNKRVVILECKLTDVQTGRAQLASCKQTMTVTIQRIPRREHPGPDLIKNQTYRKGLQRAPLVGASGPGIVMSHYQIQH